MIRYSVWPFSILASAKVCMQQAFSRARGARGDGGGAVAGEREEVARDPGAGAVSVSSRRVRSLEQVAGIQKRDPPLAATARSGVQSQQDDARVCAELVLVRVSSAAHS